MPGSREAGLPVLVLRCYSRQWRRRHGDEAAEVAVLLMRDGVPARSIAWSYLRGAARERLTPRPGRRFAAAAAAALAAASALAVALGLLSAPVPASAASSAQASSRESPATRLVTLLRCRNLLGATVAQALPALEAGGVRITWAVAGARSGENQAGGNTVPSRSFYVATGRALSPGSILIRVTATQPAGRSGADGHDGRC